jgi:hypothetical protein
VGTAASVIEKSDDYDDGNWHAKQPEQDRAAHERLLFCFRFESWRLLNGQASASFRAKSHQASNARFTFSRRALLNGGMIHIVIGEVVAAHGVAWHQTNEALHTRLGGSPSKLVRLGQQVQTAASFCSFCKFGVAAPSRPILKLTPGIKTRSRSLSGSPEILRSKPAR